MRAACLVPILAIVLATASPAWSSGVLTPRDLAWLQSNLNLPGDSPAIATLDETHKARLHALIDRARGGADKRRQAVVNFLTGTVGGSFEETLRQSLTAPPSPVGAMSGR